MNKQDIVVYDFETTSTNPHRCQPTQLGAVVIHGRKLEIQENSEFKSYIRPIFDPEECARLGLDPVTDEVLEKTHIKIEDLENAPSLQTVWQQFQQYVSTYSLRKGKWGAPVKCGMNIHSYDNIIIDRIAGGHLRNARNQLDFMLEGGIIEKELRGVFKTNRIADAKQDKMVEKLTKRFKRMLSGVEPWGWGPWDDVRQEETLFYPAGALDLRDVLWFWFENNPEVTSLSLDAMREYFGMKTVESHTADKDAMDVAELIIKFLKLHRNYAPKVKFKGAFK